MIETDAGIARSGRSAMWVGVGILASRLVGVARNVVFAHYFGDSWIADAFTAALRLPNTTQNLLGEGTLSASFIPGYVQLRGRDPVQAATFARDCLGLQLATAAGISVLGAIFARPLTHVLVPGFAGDRLELAVHLVRIFFPMTGILALSAWSLGVLNSHRKFLLPYLAPVVWSLAQIFALVAGARFASGARLAVILGYAALCGAGLQLMVQLPSVRRLLGGSVVPRFARSTEEVKRAVRALGPVVLGRGVVQISALVDTFLASLLPVGANAVMGYVQAIYMFPVSLFGVGAAAAALPEMSSLVTDVEHGRRRLQAQTSESLTRVAFTTVPATLAFLTLPDQIVGLLYQTGKFDALTTLAVAAPLAAAGTGLLANAGVRVLASAFYALGDTSTPARLAVIRVACSIGLSYALMLRYGVVGLAAGSAIGGWLEAFLLAGRARRRLGGLRLPAGRWGKILLSAVVAAAAGVATKIALSGSELHLRAVGALASFGLAYLAVAWALGLPDVRSPFAAVGRRLRK